LNEEAAAETKKFWDEKARHNSGRPSHAVGVDDPLRNRCIEKSQQVIIPAAIRATVADLQNQCDRVLDFGCGIGRWIPTLDAYFMNYHGVDISSEMLDIARQEFSGKTFSKLRNLRIDAEENSVDFVLCVAVLHHNTYINQDVMLGELSRVVRPGGQLLLFESNGLRVTESTHSVFYPRREADWIEVTERAGFRHLETTGTCYSFAERVMAKCLSKTIVETPIIYRACAFLDSYVMPYLTRFLPSRFHERLGMRFERGRVPSATVN
jgi:ubiquinone/menaquinone biosynthesis C-methylase UbiE